MGGRRHRARLGLAAGDARLVGGRLDHAAREALASGRLALRAGHGGDPRAHDGSVARVHRCRAACSREGARAHGRRSARLADPLRRAEGRRRDRAGRGRRAARRLPGPVMSDEIRARARVVFRKQEVESREATLRRNLAEYGLTIVGPVQIDGFAEGGYYEAEAVVSWRIAELPLDVIDRNLP